MLRRREGMEKMTTSNNLHTALKKLSEDIRTLADLSIQTTDDAWEKMISTVRKEIVDAFPAHHDNAAGTASLMHDSLVLEIYDHLEMLIKNFKISHKKLKRLATRDLLTGLYNRNFFNESIVRDVRRAERENHKLSIIMIDIDGFKSINDTYGHLHGDGVLQECANMLKKCVRKSDFLCRYGGDEFIAVTPMRTCSANAPLFHRIEKNLEIWNRTYATFDYRLSMSYGCEVWEKGRDIVEVLRKADKKMYAAKQKKN